MQARTGAGPNRQGKGAGDGRRSARRPRNTDLRGGAVVIGKANGAISITGIGAYAPEHVVTNDDLSQMMDTSDEWIVERTGIRERRVAADDQALSDIALPAACAALEQSGTPGADIDLIIVATVTPDMAFPSAGGNPPDGLGAPDAAAHDPPPGLTGLMYSRGPGHRPGRP